MLHYILAEITKAIAEADSQQHIKGLQHAYRIVEDSIAKEVSENAFMVRQNGRRGEAYPFDSFTDEELSEIHISASNEASSADAYIEGLDEALTIASTLTYDDWVDKYTPIQAGKALLRHSVDTIAREQQTENRVWTLFEDINYREIRSGMLYAIGASYVVTVLGHKDYEYITVI